MNKESLQVQLSINQAWVDYWKKELCKRGVRSNFLATTTIGQVLSDLGIQVYDPTMQEQRGSKQSGV